MNILHFIRAIARVVDVPLSEKRAVAVVERYAAHFDRPGRLAEIKAAFAVVLCELEVIEFDAFMMAVLTPSARRIGYLFLAIPFGSPTSWRPSPVMNEKRQRTELLTLYAFGRFLIAIDVHAQMAATKKLHQMVSMRPRITAAPRPPDANLN